jgi:ABC-2 type transport system ATP-binding protein
MFGYLPEERGLYRDLRVTETLEYLGRLKGLNLSEARDRSQQFLERLGLTEHRDKKVKELSRGLGQLVQLAVTFLHRPRLLVLDEPFSGLDPVNLRLVKEVLLEQRDQGVAIMLSTHQMNEVEELCNRVLMINAGRVVLYGGLDEVRADFGGRSIIVEGSALPDGLAGVDRVNDHGDYRELVMSEGAESRTVFRALAEAGVDVKRFEVAGLPLEDIFIQLVKETQQ